MRRNVVCLLASIVITVTGPACSLFGKRNATGAMVDSSALSVQPWGSEADPYATHDEPVALESSEDPVGLVTDRPYEETSEQADEQAWQPAPRYHTVVRKDTLYGLARMYYGDQTRWQEIYEANRSMISAPDSIRVGQRLLIP